MESLIGYFKIFSFRNMGYFACIFHMLQEKFNYNGTCETHPEMFHKAPNSFTENKRMQTESNQQWCCDKQLQTIEVFVKRCSYHIVAELVRSDRRWIVEVVDFREAIDDECTRCCQLISVHMRGTLATRAGDGPWRSGVYRRGDFGARNGTQGHYVRDLGGSVEIVRRDCEKIPG